MGSSSESRDAYLRGLGISTDRLPGPFEDRPRAAPDPEVVTNEAEVFVLGAALVDPEAREEVVQRLRPSDFRGRKRRELFRAIQELHSDGEPVDVTTVMARGIDGEFAAAIDDAFPGTTQALDFHLRTIAQESFRRAAAETGRVVTLLSGKEDLSPAEVMEEIQVRTDELRRRLGNGQRDGLALLLRDALTNPEAAEEVAASIERTVWPAHVTMLASREKGGKSTLAAAAMAAKASGHRFLGVDHEPGVVLYWFGAKEGHVRTVARMLQEFGAGPDRLYLLEEGPEPFGDLEAAVAQIEPSVVVVDTLSAFVGRLEMESADRRWDGIMSRFARLARSSGAGILILHHARKSDGKYRDSTAIGGGVDVILEMSEGEVPGVRKLEAHARRGIHVDDYSVRYVEGSDGLPPYFELAAGSLSVDARVRIFVEHNPGASKRAVRDGVRAKASEVDSAVFRLLSSGAIKDEGTEHRAKFYAVSPEDPQGHATDTGGTR